MPFEWKVEDTTGVLVVAVRGHWDTAAASRAMLAQLLASGLWSDRALVLMDLREADSRTAPHYDQLWARTRESAAVPMPRRVALLATGGATFGVARMLQELMGGDPDRVQTITDEAEMWQWLAGGAAGHTPPRRVPQ